MVEELINAFRVNDVSHISKRELNIAAECFKYDIVKKDKNLVKNVFKCISQIL